ncbi:efflux RND transporter permease subunit [Carboxylicivirga sp. A043]|uniref:efflux RND transporter permease subunit n=1 Tax=Carboxylicivirga litoralis TaxID=2816963 RepID=UPI0021CB6267|nr:efflux RND transporter permease subunit [Carboxylicivirga sp. A043]MCU4158303.1 efflux RND transporter permease subunit [Carboxylicivirga sp. A043]
MLNNTIKFFLENKLVTFLLLVIFIAWGIISSPFSWETGFLPSDPVPVDAIPDIGENQQIVYTEWAGQSPQDIEDQVSYPLTTALLGIPGVQTIRSNSIFGVSSIYIIFEEDVEFYWSRTRILEKLNSLPAGTLPNGVTPALGPDATALGQIYWYTLEGRDKKGKPNGGWDPHELRTIQDFYIKYGLTAAKGVSEVASIGGFVKEYQIDIDPNAMKAHGVSVGQIMQAVKKSNLDIGARTIEFNRVEYLIRALGYIKSLDDIEKSVVSVKNNIPIRIKDIANVSFGPATRRGGLDKGGAEAVGGVVVARYGANPLEVINNVKDKIEEISPGLPSKILDDGSVSKVTIVPFYDRTGLIKETLGTLQEALTLEVLISIIVIIILVLNLRASFLISSLLPIGVLMTFIAMRRFGVDANIVALSGIAIAIGVMVDVGVVFTENIIRHVENIENKSKKLLTTIYDSTVEVAPAVITALTTTIVSFLPVFAMQAAEGKLFKPLAFTKTFAMVSALIIGLTIIPALAHIIFSIKIDRKKTKQILNIVLILLGISFLFFGKVFIAFAVVGIGVNNLLDYKWSEARKEFPNYINIGIIAIIVVWLLTKEWMPLGAQNSDASNLIFTGLLIGLVLAFMLLVVKSYSKILNWALANKAKFLSIPLAVVLFGIVAWQGVDRVFSFMPDSIKQSDTWASLNKTFPGIGKEFMPALDEGSFLLMPTTMPHSGIEENLEVIRMLDKKVNAIPEVDNVIGKWGRVSSALDPAPTSMYENVINYKSEYMLDESGHRLRFKTNKDGAFELSDGSTYNPADGFKVIAKDQLIPDKSGEYFRQWREHINSPNDIWTEIVNQSSIPGLTSAPKLQPIQTRLVMLQTGMRAPMGIKVFGPDLETIEKIGYELENHLKHVEGVEPMSVFADRVVGKPYLELDIDRSAISRYGLTIADLQMTLSSAIGGMNLTSTVEGRERFPVRVRYAREYRDNPEDLKRILIPTPSGVQVPLGELAAINYTRGPQLIKSENTFLVGYVIFDKKEGYAEVDVVENAQAYLGEKAEQGVFNVPAGVNYKFTGNYENQIRATKRLLIVIPISLIVIFLILYFQFRSVTAASLIFSGIFVAFSGGFIMLWLYSQSWFMNFSLGGIHLQDMFQIHTINLSVAVWVGFIALFGIATDDGVLISTYLKQIFDKKQPESITEVREKVLEAGLKRVRPAMMTTATTIIALLPVLTSTGKGSDIMVPMAIPSVGGMLIATLTIFVVPVLYSMWQERNVKKMSKTLKA